MKKFVIFYFIYIWVAVLCLPLCITFCMGGLQKPIFYQEEQEEQETEDDTETEEVDMETVTEAMAIQGMDVDLEKYVIGVVAGEMPALYEMEALKAQAVAARTYQVYQMEQANSADILYDVGQVYLNEAEMKEKWGDGYPAYFARIQEAVMATAGEVMEYQEAVILASFHAQSSGITETAEVVWGQDLPYLQSVKSEGDSASAHLAQSLFFSLAEIQTQCHLTSDWLQNPIFMIQGRSEAGSVLNVDLGESICTGQELRGFLGIRSANFEIEKEENGFWITTYGYGHGCGMSQYGANELAKTGADYREILEQYYQEISFATLA